MHVTLYPQKQLQQSLRFILIAGTFLTLGGLYALAREIFILDTFRLSWAISSGVVLLAGLACLFVGNNRVVINQAYFSMNPELVKYRLAVFARERVIYWKDVKALSISAYTIVYHLTSGASIKMRLGHIQQSEVMLHVSRSIHLVALEKGIMINGVQTAKQGSVA
ncbi:hypothetical protein [uncultured Pontibacter sp.]|uniref:hypothetical protein n=1 Tax=uncultured Pontibacter sp. TaxID=453356 RepID=UPI00261F39EC|nr:hypothetical protein [uncultured Pontibacter sp.]